MTVATKISVSSRLAWEQLSAARPLRGLYAIYDCASSPNSLHDVIAASQLPQQNLLGGDIESPLLEVSPWCVHLGAHRDRGYQLFSRYWGQSCGIFASAPLDMSFREVRAQLKQMLRVQLPTGQRVMFRFYDPRVLRKFLPTSNHGELGVVFGKLTDMWCEGPNGGTLLQWSSGEFRSRSAIEHRLV